MSPTEFVLSLIANIFGISTADAREVALARFDRQGTAEFNISKNNSVSDALSAHFEGAMYAAATAGSLWEEAPRQYHRSLSSPEINTLSNVAWRISTACGVTEYSPAWWLSPEVESRRAHHYQAMVSIACESGIPANLLDAIITQESGYKPWAISSAGAMGMMQVMPETAKHLELWNPWNALANMRAGARYLRQQLDRFGRVDLALAAYNAGPERRSLTMGNIPAIPETRNYVRTITSNWLRLTQLNRPDSVALARAAAASVALRASGYREVSLVTYDGMNSANPI